MKKLVSSLLVASLAATSLAACGGSNAAPATTTQAAAEKAHFISRGEICEKFSFFHHGK